MALTLGQHPLFRGIDPQALPKTLDCLGSFERHYHKNELIFAESDTVRMVGLILSGKVQMIKENAQGNKTILVVMHEGDIFGETFACGSHLDAQVSFLATSHTHILFLPVQRVLHQCTLNCTSHHHLVENMLHMISDKNVQLIKKIEVISEKSLRDKIMVYLSMQAATQKKRYFTIPLGRVELADYLCADRSALTRELNQMREDGLIDFEKNTFRLL